METNICMKKIVANIRLMLIEQYLNYDNECPLKSMAAAMTGKYENKEEIDRLIKIEVDLNDEDMTHVSQDVYYLCKNRLTKFTRSSNSDNRCDYDTRMGYVYMLMRKADVVCCKWIYIDDEGERSGHRSYNWMNWNILAANWITYTIPSCNLEGFVYGSLME